MLTLSRQKLINKYNTSEDHESQNFKYLDITLLLPLVFLELSSNPAFTFSTLITRMQLHLMAQKLSILRHFSCLYFDDFAVILSRGSLFNLLIYLFLLLFL